MEEIDQFKCPLMDMHSPILSRYYVTPILNDDDEEHFSEAISNYREYNIKREHDMWKEMERKDAQS